MQDSADNTIRLNKYIAQHLAIGRRQADSYIEKGRITLNDKTATLGDRVDPLVDTVSVDGTAIQTHAATAFTYLALNKPVGYVSSRKQQGDNPTIYALLPAEYHHLKPVGRLDKDSSGLLLLTNDGDFAHRMTHPSFVKTKIYEVSLSKPLEPLHHQMINDHGIQLEDGVSKLHLDRITEGDSKNWLVTMHEGRNRQIRRTFASLGYSLNNLHRTNFGIYNLSDLKEGAFKIVPALG